MADSKRALLPTSVKPSHYDVHLQPDLVAFSFKGSITVHLDVKEEGLQELLFHALEITFDPSALTLSSENGNEVSCSALNFDENAQTVAASLSAPLSPGKWTMAIASFEGVLNDQMAGFYRSRYSVEGEERFMAVTQFEPTDARRAFPCWDEPSLKATFSVSLTVPTNRTALGNMPAEEEQVNGDLKTIRFGRTPIMSTYLVAFLVGEFDVVEDVTKEGVVMKVYTPLGKADQGKFALEVGKNTLSFYTDYFAIPYPLPCLAMVAISDFSAGAMENWGLVTYRETALLIDSATSGVSNKQRVAYVVAHELAHQWFGNLVTMEWWKELWLNEGFATWVGNLAVDHLFPAWDIWTKFSSDYFARAQQLDSLRSSHPIEVEVYSSDEINEIFDAISYCKGAAIIRMIASVLGLDAFKKGLQIYLKRHQYGNAVTDDLWQALQESSGVDVKSLMDVWTKHTGYPVLHAALSSATTLHVRQHRFLSSGEGEGGEDDKTIWRCSVPALAPSQQSMVQLELKDREADIPLPASLASADWLKLNAGQSGFFRVAYSDEMLAKLCTAVESAQLPPIDRLGLQGDVFALAKAGVVPTSRALRTARAYVNECKYPVWSDLAASLHKVAHVWSEEPNSSQLSAFLRGIFAPITAQLGWDAKEGESDLDVLLRALAISNSLRYENPEVITEARARFSQASSLAADLRSPVYRTAVKFGAKHAFEAVRAMYRSAENHSEKLRALQALGAAPDEELLRAVLDMTFSDEVRLQDVFYPLAAVSASPKGRALAWQYLQDNYEMFLERFKGSSFLLGRILSSITSGFVSFEKADEVEAFFKAHPAPGAERSLEQTLESIRGNAAWLERDRQDVRAFLAEL